MEVFIKTEEIILRCYLFLYNSPVILIDAIQQLRNRIKERKLICYLYHKEVKMEELAFAAWIREINPYMVNWSNVPDYLEKNAFIKFARTCSTEDTIHFVTFLNWVYYVSNILVFFISAFLSYCLTSMSRHLIV